MATDFSNFLSGKAQSNRAGPGDMDFTGMRDAFAEALKMMKLDFHKNFSKGFFVNFFSAQMLVRGVIKALIRPFQIAWGGLKKLFDKLVITPIKFLWDKLIKSVRFLWEKVIKSMAKWLFDKMKDAFEGIRKIFKTVIDFTIKSWTEGLKRIDSIISGIGKSTHLLTAEVNRIAPAIINATRRMRFFGIELEESTQAAAAILEEFGRLSSVTEESVKFVAMLAKGLGMSEQEGSRLLRTLTTGLGLSVKESAKFVDNIGRKAAKAGLATASVIRDVVGDMEMVATYAGKTADNLVDAAIQARGLQASLSTTVKIAETFSDFESAVTNSMRLNVLFGTQLNAQSLFLASQYGDIEGTVGTIVDQLAKMVKWEELSVFERKEIARLTGLTVEETYRLIRAQQRQGKEVANLDDFAFDMENRLQAQQGIWATIVSSIKGIFVPTIERVGMILNRDLLPVLRRIQERFATLVEGDQFEGLMRRVSQFAETVAMTLTRLLSDLTGGRLEDVIDKLFEKYVKGVTETYKWLTGLADRFNALLIQLEMEGGFGKWMLRQWENVQEFVKDSFKSLWHTGGTIWSYVAGFFAYVNENWDSIMELISAGWELAGTYIGDKVLPMWEKIKDWSSSIYNFMQGIVKSWKDFWKENEKGQGFWATLVDTFVDVAQLAGNTLIDVVISRVPDLLNSLINGMSSAASVFGEIFGDILLWAVRKLPGMGGIGATSKEAVERRALTGGLAAKGQTYEEYAGGFEGLPKIRQMGMLSREDFEVNRAKYIQSLEDLSLEDLRNRALQAGVTPGDIDFKYQNIEGGGPYQPSTESQEIEKRVRGRRFGVRGAVAGGATGGTASDGVIAVAAGDSDGGRGERLAAARARMDKARAGLGGFHRGGGVGGIGGLGPDPNVVVESLLNRTFTTIYRNADVWSDLFGITETRTRRSIMSLQDAYHTYERLNENFSKREAIASSILLKISGVSLDREKNITALMGGGRKGVARYQAAEDLMGLVGETKMGGRLADWSGGLGAKQLGRMKAGQLASGALGGAATGYQAAGGGARGVAGAVASGGLTALGGALGGPLGMAAGAALGKVVAGLFAKKNKDTILSAQEDVLVQQLAAQRGIQVGQQIQSKLLGKLRDEAAEQRRIARQTLDLETMKTALLEGQTLVQGFGTRFAAAANGASEMVGPGFGGPKLFLAGEGIGPESVNIRPTLGASPSIPLIAAANGFPPAPAFSAGSGQNQPIQVKVFLDGKQITDRIMYHAQERALQI